MDAGCVRRTCADRGEQGAGRRGGVCDMRLRGCDRVGVCPRPYVTGPYEGPVELFFTHDTTTTSKRGWEVGKGAK